MTLPTVALDAMGGDHAPGEVVAGALLAIESLAAAILLVGPEELIRDELGLYGHHVDDSGNVVISSASKKKQIGTIRIVNAPDFIAMDEKAASAVRSKPNSSIAVATRLVKDGVAGGIVSAGNTGAVASAALLIMGRIKGVSRPGLAVPLPAKDHPVVLIDARANADCRPDQLLHFGILGSVYSQEILGLSTPRVGILSIGEEKGKGNELVQKAAVLLEQSNLEFVGNVEGRDIPQGCVEVVVTDGFTGNITLKTLEGAAALFVSTLKDELLSTRRSRVFTLALKSNLKRFKERLDPERYGGAHLLGVRGVCVITHGSSSRRAIAASLSVAAQAIDRQLVEKLTRGLQRELASITPASAGGSESEGLNEPTHAVSSTDAG